MRKKAEHADARGSSNRTTYMVLDTTVYLHCPMFTQVDWPGLLERDSVVLLLPTAVLSELDKHKDLHPQRRRRERARSVVAEFKKAQQNPSFEFRKGVGFQSYRRALTQADFEPYGLDREIPDDKIVATILKFQAEHPNDELILVARDGTMCFTAHELGLTVFDPTSIEERDEPDETERQLELAKRRTAELESRIPKLSLAFGNGKTHFDVRLQPFVPGGEEDLQRFQAEKLKLSPPVGQLNLSHGADRSELTRYMQEHAAYFDELAEYVDDREAWREREARTVSIVLDLANKGRVPAESVVVELFFPTPSATLETEDTRPTEPIAPTPPDPPRNFGFGLAILSLSERHRYTRGFGPSEAQRSAHLPGGGIQALWEPEISTLEGEGATFTQNFRKIQQSTNESIGPIHVVFAGAPHSFGIRYVLRADNMEPVRGELHVVVK